MYARQANPLQSRAGSHINTAMDRSSQKPSVPAPQAIHHELRTTENSAAYLLPKLQSMKQANPHLTLLDVGAGSGTISVVTFAQAIPESHVTATDLNKEILLRAQAIADAAGRHEHRVPAGRMHISCPVPTARSTSPTAIKCSATRQRSGLCCTRCCE